MNAERQHTEREYYADTFSDRPAYQTGRRLSPPQILREAADLLAQPRVLLSERSATDGNGLACHPRHPQAAAFDLLGAMERVSGDEPITVRERAYQRLRSYLGVRSPLVWSRASTKSQIIAALRGAAEAVR